MLIDPILLKYLNKWKLTSPKLVAKTYTSHVYKVTSDQETKILKILNEAGQLDEKNGAYALQYYAGEGSVEIINFDSSAVLINYCNGELLKQMVLDGHDQKATKVIAELLQKIHQKRSQSLPTELTPLKIRYGKLLALVNDQLHAKAIKIANELLAKPLNKVVLHGDVHHENIINDSINGWLLIDPKGLVGESTFDTANCFYNPKLENDSIISIERIKKMAQIFSKILGIEELRILKFAYCYGHLSAVWSTEDGFDSTNTLKTAKLIENLII